MKTRLNLTDSNGATRGCWEISLPFGAIRRFDDGSKVYFFDTEWNGNHRRSYICHQGPPESNTDTKFRLKIIVTWEKDEREEFSAWGSTRREVFSKMRNHLKVLARALREIPF